MQAGNDRYGSVAFTQYPTWAPVSSPPTKTQVPGCSNPQAHLETSILKLTLCLRLRQWDGKTKEGSDSVTTTPQEGPGCGPGEERGT